MTEINITAQSTEGTVKQIRDVIGGTIESRWGEYSLIVDSDLAKGTIRFITFDWGVNLLEYDITFFDDITLIMDASNFNPIHFTYCLNGHCSHRFGYQKEPKTIEQFQSVIITSKDGGYNYGYFPKDIKLEINVIQISRQLYLKKRLNNVSELNKKLYEVFLDKDQENTFAYFGSYNLKMADVIGKLRKVKQNGMIRVLKIEGMVYQILSMHIQQHDIAQQGTKIETSLLKSELKKARKIAKRILKNVALDYNLDYLSEESGLTQAKLQEAFKILYARTVTEYVRHVRLEAARDYINTTELNVSQIVYSVGFSSRSYFSKIFKEKYNISPSEYLKSKRSKTTVPVDH